MFEVSAFVYSRGENMRPGEDAKRPDGKPAICEVEFLPGQGDATVVMLQVRDLEKPKKGEESRNRLYRVSAEENGELRLTLMEKLDLS